MYTVSMRREKLNSDQVRALLERYEKGERVRDLIIEFNLSESTFLRLKKKYSGLSESKIELKRKTDQKIKSLERKIAQQEHEMKALRAALRKKF